MERFRADILQFSSATVEIFISARQMDTTFISSISVIFLKNFNFQRPLD